MSGEPKIANKKRSKKTILIVSLIALAVYEAALAVIAQKLLKKERRAR